MTKKDVQLNIRMNKELKERIDASAKANNRTSNAEATTLLIEALEARKNNLHFTPKNLGYDPTLIDDDIRKLIEESTEKLKKAIEEEACKKVEMILNRGMNPIQK